MEVCKGKAKAVMGWLDSHLILVAAIVAIAFVLVIALILAQTQGKTMHEMVAPAAYGESFPEGMFPPSSDVDAYEARKARGYAVMGERSLAILILARNIGHVKSEMLVARMEHLARPWKACHIIVYARDSTDDTMDPLIAAQERDKRWILLPPTVETRGLTRMQRMSALRNFCVESVPIGTDYVLWIDGDLAGPVSRDGVAHSVSFLATGEYHAMFGNGLYAPLSDFIHLPLLGWTYYDPLATVFPTHGFCDALGADKTLILRRGDPPVAVVSGFAGVGLYRSDIFARGYRYKPTVRTCEHVTLHRHLYNDGYRLAINPSLMCLSGIQGGS